MGALGLQLVVFAITARGLGVEQFGRYTAVLALASVAVDVAGLGTADLLVRAVATDGTAFARFWGQVLRTAAWSVPAVALLALALAVGWMQSALASPLLLLALLAEVAVSRMAATVEMAMVAHGHTVRAGWLRVATVLARLAAALAFFVWAARGDLDGWIVAVAVQSAAVTALYVLLTGRLYGRPAWRGVHGQLWAGLSFCATQVARSLQGNLDRMVLARVGTDAQLGVYGAATRFMQLGLFPIQVGTRMLYPKFFVHGQAGPAALRRHALRSAAVMAAIGCAATLAVGAAGAAAPWVLGPSYEQSVGLCWTLALALPFMALQYPAADTLSGAGQQALRASAAIGSTGLFAGILMAAAVADGPRGVVVGFVAGHAVIASGYWYLAWRCTRRPELANV